MAQRHNAEMRADSKFIHQAQELLGGRSPTAFMSQFWQRKPLLVRQAWPGVQAPIEPSGLFAWLDEHANSEHGAVQARLVQRTANGKSNDPKERWRVRHSPFVRPSSKAKTKIWPSPKTTGWTVLVQNLDLHVPAARQMLERFRFLPDARLDDLMLSWASPGGGVGPHVDSYDVFLLQVHGRRRWRVSKPGNSALMPGLPLKILRHFEPVHDWVLEPGDMLYLPPGWGHDGTAEGGPCMTCSIGFRAPTVGGLAQELLLGLEELLAQAQDDRAQAHFELPAGGLGQLYADPHQGATAHPALMPQGLHDFARKALLHWIQSPRLLPRALGEVLTRPSAPALAAMLAKAGQRAPSWAAKLKAGKSLRLAAGSRMLYDPHGLYLNGESFQVAGRDARLLRRLADERQLPAQALAQLSQGAATEMNSWVRRTWLAWD